ncbi:MAG: N-acetyltransferase [Armatimonadetes bacterium]|nr:N-acetyltransferase [Armatimonadota bacterium]
MRKSSLSRISKDAGIGRDVRIYDFVNIYGECEIGDQSVIGAFVEIQPGVKIGRCVKISSHSFLCTGVVIEDNAFIGHGVMFTNDKFPSSIKEDGTPMTAADTKVVPTLIKRGAAVGSNATILCGVTVGEDAVVGAGSVVTRDVPPNMVVCGVPAKPLRERDDGLCLKSSKKSA